MIAKASHHKNPFIGLYCVTSEKIAFVPIDADAKLKTALKDALQVEVVPFSLYESSFLGLFCVLNSTHAVITPFATDKERAALEDLGLEVVLGEEPLSAVGNNLLLNDNAAWVNPNASDAFVRTLESALRLPVKRQPICGMSTVGSANVLTNRGILAYPDTAEAELKLLERTFSVRGAVGTTNLGSPFNRLGLVANSKGAVVGELTTGFESGRVHEALFA